MNSHNDVQLILIGILLATAFFVTWKTVLGRMRNRNAVLSVTVILAFLFICLGAVLFLVMQMVVDTRALLLTLLMLFSVVAFGGLLVFCAKHMHEMNKGAFALFVTYVLVILLITIFIRQEHNTSVRVDTFADIAEALRMQNSMWIAHMLQNMALFAPVGFLFPMMHRKLESATYTLLIGMMLSTLIETTQLFAAIGQCDIGDILMNVLGAAAGYLIFYVLRRRLI